MKIKWPVKPETFCKRFRGSNHWWSYNDSLYHLFFENYDEYKDAKNLDELSEKLSFRVWCQDHHLNAYHVAYSIFNR